MHPEDLVLYVKSGCHLCDEARARLAAAGLEVREVDVLTSIALFERYRHRVPVLADVSGRTWIEGRFDDAALRRLLRRMSPQPNP
ncbi:MAG: glutaredoxin family protein [Firmicutes bacterium]|nr:glutaredoxin family protein [Bacillota bacterium]